jgi:hypothetical protein
MTALPRNDDWHGYFLLLACLLVAIVIVKVVSG